MGANRLSDLFRNSRPVSLSALLIECGDDIGCVTQAAVVAQEAYESREVGSQMWSDGASVITGVGATGALIGVGHISQTTIRYWTTFGLLPVLIDDTTQFAADARLYNVAGQAVRALVQRYAEIQSAQARLKDDDWDARRKALSTACDDAAAAEAAVDKLPEEDRSSFADSVTALKERCDLLSVMAAKLDVERVRWEDQNELARAMATDLAALDSPVARLDRSMRSTPSQTLKSFLALPLTLASNIVSGATKVDEYKPLAHDVFDNPYPIPLTLPAKFELPPVCPETMSMYRGPDNFIKTRRDRNPPYDHLTDASAARDAIDQARRKLVDVTLDINNGLAKAQAVEALDGAPIMRIDFRHDDHAIVFAGP